MRFDLMIMHYWVYFIILGTVLTIYTTICRTICIPSYLIIIWYIYVIVYCTILNASNIFHVVITAIFIITNIYAPYTPIPPISSVPLLPIKLFTVLVTNNFLSLLLLILSVSFFKLSRRSFEV